MQQGKFGLPVTATGSTRNIRLYIVLAYLMLFAALTNAVCLNNASLFYFIDLCKCFLFSCFVFVYFHMNDFSFFFICIMHSAFNLFVFPNYMFTSLFFRFCFLNIFMKGL